MLKQKLTSTASSWAGQAGEPNDQTSLHSRDRWTNKDYNKLNTRTMMSTGARRERDTHTLITLLSLLHVTWNQVHGLTSVGSQLCKTLFGSIRLALKLCSASPVTSYTPKA